MLIVSFSASCVTYKFVDSKSSFENWNLTPNNSKLLEIKLIDADSKKEIKKRDYYLTFDECNESYSNLALVEVNKDFGVMNKFSIPSNHDTLILNERNLFPPISILNKHLEVYTYYIGDSMTLNFYCKKVFPDGNMELLFEKVVQIDLNTKVGILTDTTGKEKKIWY